MDSVKFLPYHAESSVKWEVRASAKGRRERGLKVAAEREGNI